MPSAAPSPAHLKIKSLRNLLRQPVQRPKHLMDLARGESCVLNLSRLPAGPLLLSLMLARHTVHCAAQQNDMPATQQLVTAERYCSRHSSLHPQGAMAPDICMWPSMHGKSHTTFCLASRLRAELHSC